MASPRVRKIADRIKVVVAEMLERRVKDPRLGFVTVTDVRVSGDTQQATVFYTVFALDKEQSSEDLAGTAAALESAKGLIRSEVGKQLGMRHVPNLEFIHDALPETARHIDDLLEKAREADAAVAVVDALGVVGVVGVLVGLRTAVGVGLARVRRAGRRGRDRRIGGPRPGQQLVDGPGTLRERVVDELQGRHVPHPELLADLGPDQALGRLQRGGRAVELVLLTEHGVEHRRVLGVPADPDVGDRHEAQARILDPPLEHLGHHDPDPVRYLADPRVAHRLALLIMDALPTRAPRRGGLYQGTMVSSRSPW